MSRLPEWYTTYFDLSEDQAKHIYEIGERIAHLWESNRSIPFYTTHGPKHNEAVIDLLKELIATPNKPQLSQLEVYYLLLGAWVHDVGMLDLDMFGEQYNPNTVRGQHHMRSARWVHYYSSELRFEAAEANIIAFLAKMHRKKEDISTSPRCLTIRHQNIRVRLICALLRLADALHIDETRAPTELFSLYSMAGMPAVSKFHWLKARVVQGIKLNLVQGLIEIQIGIPDEAKEKNFRPLIDFITIELEEEIETVRQTFSEHGWPFVIEVRTNIIPIPGLEAGQQRADEIAEINNLLAIDVSPNARRLLDMLLKSINKISSSPRSTASERTILKTLENLKEYAKDIVGKIVTRRCHIAAVRIFTALVLLLKGEEINEWYSLNLPMLDAELLNEHSMEMRLTELIEGIRFPTNSEICKNRLDGIRAYFESQSEALNAELSNLSQHIREAKKPVLTKNDRILLYGNSSSVIDILASANDDVKENLEILVAECRVKSNYSPTNRIIYNDGVEYARRILAENFKKVAIIPDAAIAHMLLPNSYYQGLIENRSQTNGWLQHQKPCTKIFFGFNGLDIERKFAVHSCGHLALVILSKNFQTGGAKTKTPEVYIVGTTSKCGRVDYKHTEPRETTWITGSETYLLYPNLSENGKLERILSYNPIDDIIKLELVDYIVSDLGILPPEQFLEKFSDYRNDMALV